MSTKLLRLAAASVFLTTTSLLPAAIPPAENLLPSDTIAFVTVPDCVALRAASKVSPQLMFWNDPAMKPFHDKFMNKLTETFIAPLEKDLGLKVADFADLPQGQFTFGVNLNGSNGHDEIPPGLLLLLDAKGKSDQLKTNLAALTKKLADKGRTIRTEKIRGLTFSVITLSTNDLTGLFGQGKQVSEIGKEPKAEQPVDIYFTQYESLLIVGTAPKLMDAVAAHLTGGSVPSIADDATFAADRLSQFRNSPTYYGWFNGKLVMNMIAQTPKDSSDDADSPMPKFSAAKILGVTGLGNLKSASFALHEGREGTTADFHLTTPADGRNGFLKILAIPAKDSAPPAFVPADVIKFTRVRLDGKQTWAEIQKIVAGISPQGLAGLNSVIDLANSGAQQKDPSFDLRNNLFGNLGDDIINYTKAPVGGTLAAIANPPTITLIGTPNADQIIQAIKIVAGMITPQDSSLQPREFRGHKIHTVALRPQRGPNGAVIPATPLLLSSGGGYLAITTDAGILEEFLRSSDGKIKPLREIAGLTEAAARVGGMGNGLFSYQNAREVMRSSFKLLKGAAEPTLQRFPTQFREWADFTLLPEYDTVAKYFYLSVFANSTGAEGLTLRVFTPRPPTLN